MNKYSTEEIEYLRNNIWQGTEKIDGTNIKIHWTGSEVVFGGKGDNSSIPANLLKVLMDVFSNEMVSRTLGNTGNITLYGEGFGNGIQKRGKEYIPDGVDIILFDIFANGCWFKREKVDEIALQFGIKSVPIMFEGTIEESIKFVSGGFNSTIGTAKGEGLVLIPKTYLVSRMGNRIITKIKTIDF